MKTTLSKTFIAFFESEKAGGVLLLLCTLASIVTANSLLGPGYQQFWETEVAGMSFLLWVNDALMAIFFLLVGLELERELYGGELSDFRNALLPILAAIGGIAVPALIHFSLNAGTPSQGGVGIPMATDIAFALGALSLLGKRIPPSLKLFLTALAVMDDLGAIVVIAVFYGDTIHLGYLLAALAIFGVLFAFNRVFRVMHLSPYLLGGIVLWFFVLKSGVHATIAGVLLAFTIPFSSRSEDERSPSHRLETFLHRPVAFVVLPIFALANTAILVGAGWRDELFSANSMGIIAGLVLGKPLGICLTCLVAVASGLCKLPGDLTWRHIVGAGLLAGIGFTMSIFITNLAFPGHAELVVASKIAIMLASLFAGALGIAWLRFSSGR